MTARKLYSSLPPEEKERLRQIVLRKRAKGERAYLHEEAAKKSCQ